MESVETNKVFRNCPFESFCDPIRQNKAPLNERGVKQLPFMVGLAGALVNKNTAFDARSCYVGREDCGMNPANQNPNLTRATRLRLAQATQRLSDI